MRAYRAGFRQRAASTVDEYEYNCFTTRFLEDVRVYSGTEKGSRSGFTGRMGAGVFTAFLAMAVIGASACSSDDVVAPQVIAGPESLTVQLEVASTTIDFGQVITLRATALNESDATVVARYGVQACGLEVILQTADGAPVISSGQGCLPPASQRTDTLPPSRSVGLDANFGNIPRGTYRAQAVFRAANGIAPNSQLTTVTIR
ncbi:MAG: hypothetical protein ABIY52_09375 [Gemmatimonadaceae bacterium]